VLYNTSTGIFQALGDSRHPLYYLIISSLANILLDLLFVVVLNMGVAGAALATVIGQGLSAALGFIHLFSGRFIVQLSWKKLRLHVDTLKTLISLGFPSGVQNSMISIANVVVQSNINAFGDNAMAGCGSYSKVEGFVFLPIVSLTMALTTFVSQNLGAKKFDRVKSGVRTGIVMAVVVAQLVGITYFLLAPQVIGLFSKSPEVVAFGIRQARTEALFYGLLAFAHSTAAVLRGAGRPMIPMAIMLGIWCILRIGYITLMVWLFHDITVVFTAYPVTWGLSCLLFAYFLKHQDQLYRQIKQL
jgi:putative MATE family efflux protein